jgi:hypothetical protein
MQQNLNCFHYRGKNPAAVQTAGFDSKICVTDGHFFCLKLLASRLCLILAPNNSNVA